MEGRLLIVSEKKTEAKAKKEEGTEKMTDYMVRATAADAQIRAFAVTSRELVEYARSAHNTSPVVTAAPCPPGERLTLPGARGSRSVKRLCLDRRISLAERDRLPAIYVEGKLAAVWRLGVDAAFAPEGREPCRFIKIEKPEQQIEEDGHDAQ